jgi:hypothetical protein
MRRNASSFALYHWQKRSSRAVIIAVPLCERGHPHGCAGYRDHADVVFRAEALRLGSHLGGNSLLAEQLLNSIEAKEISCYGNILQLSEKSMRTIRMCRGCENFFSFEARS